ncbi:2-oxo-4-hydroxy-4-carboxy-5-ureidoimidazoline decarboxylase [Sphaerimonospora sp. CA-214678]|uniref:2-oxo-4-hydroxy-4-carboxy-5-ureidoimidazoline decarboxylase n=1 Tax=Sphaerimonospora sp. CA-214678 TaxID=3240029 RepID=UPI003D90318E
MEFAPVDRMAGPLCTFGMRELGRADLRSCCACACWVSAVAARRPYRDLDGLRRAGAAALAALSWPDVLEALAVHPRIGERPAGDGREAAWSRAEQASVGQVGTGQAGAGQGGAGRPGADRVDAADREGADREVLDALRAGNAAYESRFGHVYLVSATGRGARELLGLLRARLGNDAETERAVVRAELGKIVELRLAKLWQEAR